MPSQSHEALLALFRNRPSLAAELLRDVMDVQLPTYVEARVESAELNEVTPVEYRADLVVVLYDERPLVGIVVEVQLSPDSDKQFAWPMYVASLRARFRCPACLLVVAGDDATARWARQPVDLGGGNRFVARVIGPTGVPEITNEAQARSDPELAVLSAMSHGSRVEHQRSLDIALAAIAASSGLDADRAVLYVDLVLNSLTEAARRALQDMDLKTYQFQSDFARHYVGVGRAEGKAQGKADMLVKLLALRFGVLPDDAVTRVQTAKEWQLDAIAERFVRAGSLGEALGD